MFHLILIHYTGSQLQYFHMLSVRPSPPTFETADTGIQSEEIQQKIPHLSRTYRQIFVIHVLQITTVNMVQQVFTLFIHSHIDPLGRLTITIFCTRSCTLFKLQRNNTEKQPTTAKKPPKNYLKKQFLPEEYKFSTINSVLIFFRSSSCCYSAGRAN